MLESFTCRTAIEIHIYIDMNPVDRMNIEDRNPINVSRQLCWQILVWAVTKGCAFSGENTFVHNTHRRPI